MVSEERKRQLAYFWLEEDDFPWEWRTGLNGEERELVESWDKQFTSSVYRFCLDILQGNGM